MQKTEMRLDPLTEAWTIFSESRALHPAFGSSRRDAEENPQPDPFLAGRECFAPHALHTVGEGEAWKVRVVPNRAPVLQVEGDATRHAAGFYDRMDGVGAHEVTVEAPGEEALEDLPLQQVEQVIAAWKLRMVDLMRDTRMRSFSIVKNVGRAAGGLTSHAVSQLVALAIIHPELKRRLDAARAFYEIKKRSIFEDILSEEVAFGERLVYENNGFAVFCPYASRVPFEVAIYPKRQCPDFHGLSDQEMAQLADALRTVLRKLGVALDHPAYNLMLFTAPTRTDRRDHWTSIERDFRWHIEIMPRLHHLGGLEFGTGCWVNSVWPEKAAEFLRNAAIGGISAAMIAKQAFYEGRVQGVGFRWMVKNTARGFDVTGWVRNLEDGRVELHVQGEQEEVEAFLEAIAESEMESHIKKLDIHPAAVAAESRGFEIAR